MNISELCLRIDALIQRLDTYKQERDTYRDALLHIICTGDTESRRLARNALDASPSAHTRPAAEHRLPSIKGRG